MDKIKFNFNEESLNEVKDIIKADKDCLSIIEKLKINDEELDNNLNLFFEYINSLKPCKNCVDFKACSHYPKGLKNNISRDMNGYLSNNLVVCDKCSDQYYKRNNLVYSTYDFDAVVDDKNVVALKNNLSLFTSENKEGIKHILKNEFIKGLYIKIVDSKLRKAVSLGLANSFLKGSKVALLSFPTLVKNLKGDYNKFNQDLFDDIKDVKVMVITDIGSESISAFSRDDVLLNLLDYRLQNNFTTVIINSYELNDLSKLYKINYNDGLKANLVVEKIKELVGE